MKLKKNRIISIRLQLPLLICLLLLVMILLFGTISYMGIRRASMAIGQQRLQSLTEQISGMLQQSAHNLVAGTRTVANSQDILDYLQLDPAHPSLPGKATAAFQKLLADTQTVWVELRDLQGRRLLSQGKPAMPDPTQELMTARPDSNMVGKLYRIGDSLYYPIIALATRDGKPLGYLLRWRAVRTSSKSVTDLSKLMGSKAALYVGNNDGSLWTDMAQPVPAPPLAIQNIRKIARYDRPDGEVIAYMMPIPGSRWMVAVELSETLILEAAGRFLYWIIGIGALLILTGSLIAWLISRNFTGPLDRLMRAAGDIEAGDYSALSGIDTHRRDELGKLALSFNSMAARVHHVQEELEHKVESRTQELEAANKELEAFSYSVSHDLRAPLRAVSGYTMMLKEDYDASFDDEARRITENILANVKMMGRLIDDLLAFSRLGKREVRRQPVDIRGLAEAAVADLSAVSPTEKFRIDVAPMPACKGDSDLLKQVWMNLIGNAIKYSSKRDDPHIAIGSMEDTAGPIYFVRDNGAGFEMKYVDKLFKVFQRLHSHEEFEGTGIGLALVKRIVDKHKGQIWAESSPGNGAVFYFRLPA
ncbi:MAG TPA: ATP-binding protein [Puia sp.]|jgi:signal transduction histidine kinase|nr:ATP-binding protein [Puia sp.]